MPSQDVRLSVRLSHAGILSRLYIYPQSFFTIGYPRHSSFPTRNGWQYSDGDLPKNGGVECKGDMKQELSYRKQIARQLRTQYVEGTHIKVKDKGLVNCYSHLHESYS